MSSSRQRKKSVHPRGVGGGVYFQAGYGAEGTSWRGEGMVGELLDGEGRGWWGRCLMERGRLFQN